MLRGAAIVLVLPVLALAETPRFALDKRVPLTTSRVVGWPDPPPPYKTRRVLEKHAFRSPVHLHSHPRHDRLFVVELGGKVVTVSPSGEGRAETFLQLPETDFYALTFHPKYATNGLVYVFTNGPNTKEKRKNQILRFRVTGSPPVCDVSSKQVVIEWASNGHNGGDLAFGPDGMLYVTSGDGTSDSDTDNTGQDLRDLCSGVLRIDVDKPAAGMNYAVPPDNPFVKQKDARGELWAFGFRNPWRMTFDPTSGDLLVGDVGQDLWEMIRFVTRGSNHGWSVTEGSKPFQPLRAKGPGEVVPPLIEHPHSESRSITGGVVYQGKRFPELRGVYVYGDYSTGKIWGLRQKGGKVTWTGDLAQTRLQLVAVGTDRDGELYLVDHTGIIHQLEKAPPSTGPSAFPRRLSESGLFLSVKDHKLHPAMIPYSVNSPLWSDGAHKERAIGLPGTETIGFTEGGAWEFPDKTVLVKTFAIDTPQGKRRRIETRFMTKQDGEWYGYSYAWADDQSDATLVDAGGITKSFAARDGALAWRYPSRVECMVCHSRAANYVLGLQTAQINRDHDYGGVTCNQLVALAKLDVLRQPKVRHWEAIEEKGRDFAGVFATLTQAGLRPVNQPLGKYLDAKAKAVHGSIGGVSNKLARPLYDYARLADPMDASADRTARVRSYLHANCANCHVEAGGGNSAINLHLSAPLDKMKLVGVPPLHDRFGVADAKLVAPGSPERSILQERLARRGKGQMPPLASTVVDEQALKLIREWIRELK